VTGVKDLPSQLSLVVITDPSAPLGVLRATEGALAAGAPCIQLRWKNAATREILELGRQLRAATLAAGALLLVNDRVDIAIALGADGAHLGDDDIPLEAARRIAPPGFLLGRSVDDAEQAEAAERGGADYVGVGPVFPTLSKGDTGDVIGEEGVREIRARVRLPVVGIGGIDAGSAGRVVAAGADGVAVISALMGAADPAAATREILRAIREGSRSRGRSPAPTAE